MSFEADTSPLARGYVPFQRDGAWETEKTFQDVDNERIGMWDASGCNMFDLALPLTIDLPLTEVETAR
ncbi:unnamed protein product [Clonostachys chloroleuca]|uniref:Uncharacterized protein n=1 Tax=Clonostachys chloroleuca TaxID=1926264 RepID=A0AA35PZR1_9HYPO|nr:unnamed protein product [Clonostachys chloroleuca]